MLSLQGCLPQLRTARTETASLPASFNSSQDSSNTAKVKWKDYFNDPNLNALIDTALRNNQELNITLQEIEISKNEVKARSGEYLPFVGIRGGAGVEKAGRFTRNGAVEKNLEIEEGRRFPEPLPDYMIGTYASWELDVWRKLRTAKKAAVLRYLSSVEGKNFMVTNLIAEIANSYYELTALDNQLDMIQRNIALQSNVLKITKQQMEAAKVTQLAVNRFEAQLLHTQNLQYAVKQQITETENRINFLTGRYPQPVTRNSSAFNNMKLDSVSNGVPSQLLENRTDIRRAELDLAAAKLDLKVAKANFYPSFRITAGAGLQAFHPKHLINPESAILSLGGDVVAPLVNRNAIKADYYTANAKQIQAVYNYERTVLNAYIEVSNQLSRISNFSKSYEAKSREVDILTRSVAISNSLFNSARADYMEVLLTQREAFESRIDLIEMKMKQMNAKVNIYKALGGGWN
jgi:NodT family efflux transporter outer membrane factor (OMF) lipoprotein